jgi:hypothetical protein
VQFLAALGVERLEEPVFDPLYDRAQPRELPLAVRGERDGVAASVVGVAPPAVAARPDGRRWIALAVIVAVHPGVVPRFGA